MAYSSDKTNFGLFPMGHLYSFQEGNASQRTDQHGLRVQTSSLACRPRSMWDSFPALEACKHDAWHGHI